MAHHIDIPANEKRHLDELGSKVQTPAMVVGLLGLGLAMIVSRKLFPGVPEADQTRQFFFSYLVAFCLFLGLSLGALAFVMIQFLTRAAWSVAVRRLAEGMASAVWMLALLAVPIYLGRHHLYIWTLHHDLPEELAHHLHKKAAYLNEGFFVARLALYFVVWIGLAFYFRARSLEQDRTGNPALTGKMERMSMLGIFLFAFSISFAAFDLIMSLDPTWFSTIFGVYYFAGSMLSFYGVLILIALWLQKNGRLAHTITHEHYHDLGKWLFAFTFFWGYVAFSQYMLIWYANIPEETKWMQLRTVAAPWRYVSLILLFGHLVIPFLGLLSRHTKRRLGILAFWAAWVICAQYVDLYWLIMPEAKPVMFSSDPHNVYVNGTEVVKALEPRGLVLSALCAIGVGGLWLAATMAMLRGPALTPLKDPRLPESLSYQNA